MATELLKGKSVKEARELSPDELTGELGPLPPMKIHCGQLVEGALQNALGGSPPEPPTAPGENASTLASSLADQPAGTIRIVPLEDDEDH